MRRVQTARLLTLSLACSTLAGLSSAQDFNLDIGAAGTSVPSASYAAAGIPGTWNAVVLPHTTPSQQPQAVDELLVDVNGNPTAVRVHQFGGQGWVDDVDAALSGDDAALLNDGLVTNSLTLDSCLYINGLEPGLYEVLTYMWMPNHPEVTHKSKMDTVPGTLFTSGAWSGAHAEGVSYTRTFVQVTNGFIGPHAGIAAGGDASLGGAINAMQIRKIDCVSANFCSATSNSTGSAATISSNGDCSVAANSFSLTASPVPDQFGIFFYGSSQLNGGNGVPFGDGLRCVGGGAGVARLPVAMAASQTLSWDVDLTAPPQAWATINAGSTWHFQAWFRDPAAGGTGFNLSNGLTAQFH